MLSLLLACGASDPPPSPDAIEQQAGTCTRAVYDQCTDNSQCESNDCHLFMQSGIQVCTTPCTPNDNATCPIDATGANGTCNNKGICKPAVANDCAP